MTPKDKKKLLKHMRGALKESVKFFSSGNKGAIEHWACREFLHNLGVVFQEGEVTAGQDPPDIIFRHAPFEV